MYRSYTRSLADEMRRRSLVERGFEVAEDDAALQALLGSDDARDVRLGLDLLPGVVVGCSTGALREMAEHADPEVRMRALVQLAAGGDAGAPRRRQRSRPTSPAPPTPSSGARRCPPSVRGGSSTSADMLLGLLDDRDPTVRAAALDGVIPEDAVAPELVRRVVAALEEPRLAGARRRRFGGSATRPSPSSPRRSPATEPRDALLCPRGGDAATEHGLAVIEPALDDRDRVVVLAALDALDAAGGADVVPPDILEMFSATPWSTQPARMPPETRLRRWTARSACAGRRDRPRTSTRDRDAHASLRGARPRGRSRHRSRRRPTPRTRSRGAGRVLSREEAAVALPLVRRD